MKKAFVVTAFALLLAACGSAESDAQKAVRNSLKDPDSAKFGQYTLVNSEHACLTVNARNSFGGYTGDQQATLVKIEKEWMVINIDKFSHESCVDVMRKIAEKSK